MNDPIHQWHAYMASRDPAALSAILHEDCVFISPVVHTPQRGKAITEKYLLAAAVVLGGPQFTYLGEWRAERSAVLEFETEVKDITINGVDMIWWDERGLITRFKVMVRPLKAISMLHAMMAAKLMEAES
jgi:ketosteroid isomerase-like protein